MENNEIIKDEILSSIEEISKKVRQNNPQSLNQRDFFTLFLSSLIEEEAS